MDKHMQCKARIRALHLENDELRATLKKLGKSPVEHDMLMEIIELSRRLAEAESAPSSQRD